MKKAIISAVTAAMLAGIASVSHADDVKMSGVSFLRYTWQTSEYTRTGTISQKDRNTFFVDRIYLTAKKKFDNGYSMRATLETKTSKDAAISTMTLKHSSDIWLKYAYIEKKDFLPGMKLRFGQSPLPWVGFEEKIWGRRYVNKVFVDDNGYMGSTDIGVNVLGKAMDGMIDYHAGIYNGSGYKGEDASGYNGKFKEIFARASVSPVEGLQIHAFMSTGNTAPKTERRRVIGGVSYKNDMFHVMGLYFNQRTQRLPVKKAEGFSIHGSVNLGTGFAVFARGDLNNVDVDATDNKVLKIWSGIEKELTNGIKIALVDKYESPEKRGPKGTGPQEANFLGIQALVKF